MIYFVNIKANMSYIQTLNKFNLIKLGEILNYAKIESPKFFRAARNLLSSNLKLIILNNSFILKIFYKCKEVSKKNI